MERFFNVIIPIVAVMLIVGVIMYLANKGGTRNNSHYDEMQLKIRATGYKIGFFVTLIGLFVFGFLIECVPNISKVISPAFCMMSVGLIGIFTFAVYCIFNDAFYSIGQSRKRYMYICVLVIITNGLGAVRHISDGNLIEGGTVTFSNCGGLVCAIGFLIILISLIVKEAMSRKEVGE